MDILKAEKTTETSVEKTSEKKKAEEGELQHGGLMERLARVKTSRWIRFGLVSAVFFAWVAWLGNWWVALAWFLLADIYLTQFIPWTWWRHSKSKVTRTVMGWVDAIVYALVLVYFLFLFVGQNYQIPSSSLEKTLLTGDFLWVNKMVYGPRVPQTPLHFPLTQNTLPWLNCKSYIEHPQLAYHRLKGLRSVERGDIVVFNFPAGDTVATRCPNPDYYTLCYERGAAVVKGNKELYGDIIYRPVDRRDNYVKRCVGLPGETLAIKGGVIHINGVPQPQPENVQFFYWVQTDGTGITIDMFEKLGISVEDRHLVQDAGSASGLNYVLPLTAAMKAELEAKPWVKSVERMVPDEGESKITYPVGEDFGWTHQDYGPVIIPKKGMTVKLSPMNIALYARCIKNYEGNSLEVRGGKAIINGQQADTYTFAMDYYWMMGDNRDNSLDSRYWGFVPEDHIVGTPMIVLISFNKDKPLLSGGIRWNRIFKMPNPDKK